MVIKELAGFAMYFFSNREMDDSDVKELARSGAPRDRVSWRCNGSLPEEIAQPGVGGHVERRGRSGIWARGCWRRWGYLSRNVFAGVVTGGFCGETEGGHIGSNPERGAKLLFDRSSFRSPCVY